MRKMSEILTSALESFEDGKHWYQGAFLYNSQSSPQNYADPNTWINAERFCALGAIGRDMILHGEPNPFIMITRDLRFQEKIHDLMAPEWWADPNRRSIAGINDSAASFDTVKEMFCTGIKNALAEEEKQELANGSNNQ